MNYQITSQAGIDLGTYTAATPIGALDALACAAGATSWAATCTDIGTHADDWTADRFAFRRGGIEILVAEVDDVTDAQVAALQQWVAGEYLTAADLSGLPEAERKAVAAYRVARRSEA